MSCTFRRLSRESGHGGGSGFGKNLSAGCLHGKSAQWKKNHSICGEKCRHGSNDCKTVEGEHHQGSSGRKTVGARYHDQAGCKADGAGYHGLTLRKMVEAEHCSAHTLVLAGESPGLAGPGQATPSRHFPGVMEALEVEAP